MAYQIDLYLDDFQTVELDPEGNLDFENGDLSCWELDGDNVWTVTSDASYSGVYGASANMVSTDPEGKWTTLSCYPFDLTNVSSIEFYYRVPDYSFSGLSGDMVMVYIQLLPTVGDPITLVELYNDFPSEWTQVLYDTTLLTGTHYLYIQLYVTAGSEGES